MPGLQVNGTFISEKLSKIRWIPEQYTSNEKSFATGSWNFNQNHVKLWKLSQNEYSENEIETIPICTAKHPIGGDVTALNVFNFDNLVVGSSDGSLSLLNINRNLAQNNLTQKQRFDALHKFVDGNNAPCTDLSLFDTDVATVGEDGVLNIISLNSGETIKSFQNADSCSLTCVSFINQREILTGNRMGIMKMFDIRTDNDRQVGSFLISCQDDKLANCVSCIVYHPTQKHIILTGSEEGSITVWDLRQPNFPASYLSAHETPITELNFHQTEPSKMFSASEGGELFMWTHTGGTTGNITAMIDNNQLKSNEIDTMNPWLSGERTKNKIDGKPLINGIQKSINSFDSNGSKLISCCDNEAIYLIENMD